MKGLLTPLPAEISQNDPQSFLFTRDTAYASQYPVMNQKTSIT